jgi:transposase
MNTDEKRAFAAQFPVHVGVDTSKTFHKLVARGPDGRRQKPLRVAVTRDGFDGAHDYLRRQFPDVAPSQVLIALEFAGHHGFTFAHNLHRLGYHVVSVLPEATSRTKAVEDNTGAKTDDIDTRQICRLVGDGIFVRFPFLVKPYLELKLLTTQRFRLTVESTPLRNRLRGLMDLVWPELLGQFVGLEKATVLAVLDRWPLPADLAKASVRTVRRALEEASRGHFDEARLTRLLLSARRTVGLGDAATERRLEIENLLRRWTLVRAQRDDLEARIEALVPTCPEARLLMTVSEVGSVTAASIVAGMGTPADFEHHRQMLKLAGLTLKTRESGLSTGRKRVSKKGRPVLRRQLYLLAGRWCSPRGLFHAEYLRVKERNGRQGTKAVVTMARRLVPVLFAVMRRGCAFDPERWAADRCRRAA